MSSCKKTHETLYYIYTLARNRCEENQTLYGSQYSQN